MLNPFNKAWLVIGAYYGDKEGPDELFLWGEYRTEEEAIKDCAYLMTEYCGGACSHEYEEWLWASQRRFIRDGYWSAQIVNKKENLKDVTALKKRADI